MISIILMTLQEIQKEIANRTRERRLELNLSQQTLSSRSGVSYGSLKKFEQTGQIYLQSLIKLAVVLRRTEDFKSLFAPAPAIAAKSLDELIKDDKRKRGRK